MKAGDVITKFNDKAVQNTTDLQKAVSATKPGTSVNLTVVRNGKEQPIKAVVEELDLDAERGSRQTRSNEREQPEVQGQDSFGLTLSNLTPQMARRLQMPSGQSGAVVTDVDENGPSAGILREGDVILSVNGQAVASAMEAGRELQRIDVVVASRASSCGAATVRCSSPSGRNSRIATSGVLLDLIRTSIHERGPMTVAAFMDLALYHPEFGYYARASRRSGRAGDFVTSVDLGPLFGELLALQIAEMSQLLGPAASPLTLVEAGAGDGRLSHAILRGLKKVAPSVCAHTHLHLVERSAFARAAQHKVLTAWSEQAHGQRRVARGVRRHHRRQRTARRHAGPSGHCHGRGSARSARRRRR